MYNLKAVIVKREENSTGKVNIKIRLSAKGKTRYISTEWWIDSKDWNAGAGCVLPRRTNSAHLNRLIPGRILQVEERLIELGNKFPEMSMRAIMVYIRGNSGVTDFYTYTAVVVSQLKKAGKDSNADAYRWTVNAIKLYHVGSTLDFREINPAWLSMFEVYMLSKGKKINTVSARMRAIRAIYRRAINEDVIDEKFYPFNKFKIKSEAGEKRALTIDEMKRMRNAKLIGKEAIARDIFMLSFYLIGINMKDLVFLKNIDRGRVKFHRAKTNREYSIKVFPEAVEIINRYRGREHLLRFKDQYVDYRETTKIVNRNMKKIVKHDEIKIPYPVTTYYARYSWATIASGLGVPKDVISHALGHGTTSLTDIYIDFDLDKVDEANEMVIKAITTSS